MKKIRKVIRFLPPLIWMGLIFWASSQPKVGMTGNYWISFAVFKSLHIIEYGLLYLLWYLAFYRSNYKEVTSFFISLTYGISDEIHQTFVPTREGRIRDVIIDLFGIIIFSRLLVKVIMQKLKEIKILQRVYNFQS